MDSDVLRVLLALGLIVILVVGLNYRNNRRDRGREAARQMAINHGLKVEEVERDAIWTRGIHRGKGLRTFTVARYSVRPRNPSGAPWSLLQRWKGEGSSMFPGHWQLQCERGEPTPALMRVLDEIVSDEQWAEEFMEVEFLPDRISIYWDETGIEGVQKVLGYLRRLDG